MSSRRPETEKEETVGGVGRNEAENAAETLLRAEEIKKDKKLHTAAHLVIHKKYEAMKTIHSKHKHTEQK